MDASAKKILTALQAGQYAPVYVLQGEETYYIDLISDYIEAHALAETDKGFNQVVVYGKDAPVATILTHARRYPMMAERQVVIVKEAQEVPDLQKEGGAKLLLDYVSNPTPSTILVLCHKHKAWTNGGSWARRSINSPCRQFLKNLTKTNCLNLSMGT